MNKPSFLRRKEETATSVREKPIPADKGHEGDDDALCMVACLIRWILQEHNSKHIPKFHGSIPLTKEEIPLLAGDNETNGVRQRQITRDVISVVTKL